MPPPGMDIPPVRADVLERLCQKVADKAKAAADKAKSDADEASDGARAAWHGLGARDAAHRSAEMFPMSTTELKTLLTSDVDKEKTLAEVFEQCGLGQPIENPLRHMRPGTTEWAKLSSDDKKKAEGRFNKMFKSWEKAGERRDYDAAAQKMTDQYPICAWKDCEKIATVRCGRCDSDTQKYCSMECQRADYSRHKPKCLLGSRLAHTFVS